jgi:hypothetical protein
MHANLVALEVQVNMNNMKHSKQISEPPSHTQGHSRRKTPMTVRYFKLSEQVNNNDMGTQQCHGADCFPMPSLHLQRTRNRKMGIC